MATARSETCPSMEGLPDEALVQVASYFQSLSEPTRLQILNFLRQGGRSVGELAQLCGYSSANISRHLALLTQHGLVVRQSRGNSALYTIADPSVYALCDLVCGNIARQLERLAAGREAFVTSQERRAGKAPGPAMGGNAETEPVLGSTGPSQASSSPRRASQATSHSVSLAAGIGRAMK